MMRALALLILSAISAQAESVVLGLSQTEVAITTDFAGSSLLIFGAVKREAPLPEGAPLDVVIAVAGPSEPVDVRRKARRMGIWVNTDAVHMTRIPSFYAVAGTKPLDEILSDSADAQYRISIERALQTPNVTGDVDEIKTFVEALVRIRTAADRYQVKPGEVTLDEQTLFRTSINLPSNLVEGNYSTRIFLVRGGAVVDFYQTVIAVQKVGMERWLFALSREQPLIYGVMSLVIAIAAGWLASAAFRVFQR